MDFQTPRPSVPKTDSANRWKSPIFCTLYFKQMARAYCALLKLVELGDSGVYDFIYRSFFDLRIRAELHGSHRRLSQSVFVASPSCSEDPQVLTCPNY